MVASIQDSANPEQAPDAPLQPQPKPAPVALVTGASRGIGRAIALELGRFGATVVVNYSSSPEAAESVVAELTAAGGRAWSVRADVADEEQVEAMVKTVLERESRLDVLVNNAGITRDGLLMRMKTDDWRQVLDLNLTGVFLCTRAVSRSMLKARHGRIIHMSSVTGPVTGIDGSAADATAKAGLLGMVRVLALEYGGQGITANCIGPGWIDTASSSEAERIAGRHTPVGRPGTPDEVAHAALFLAADEASYVTGQMIVVDGGNTVQEYKISL
jgi:3-oxoacyl-[acyl-carrier protein] reductase